MHVFKDILYGTVFRAQAAHLNIRHESKRAAWRSLYYLAQENTAEGKAAVAFMLIVRKIKTNLTLTIDTIVTCH